MADRKPRKHKAAKPAKKPKKQPAFKRQAKAAAKPEGKAKPPRKSAAVERMLQSIMEAGRDKATGRFKPGHRFWEARATSGPAPKFADADALWKACVEYFCWVEDNPLTEVQLVTFQGFARHEDVAKMRPMTIRGLCIFIGIAYRTWNEWKQDRADLLETIERVDAVIYTQKFAGAAAGLLNPNLIARELGLADKQEHMGEGGGPIKTEDVTPQHPGADRMADMGRRYFAGVAARAAGAKPNGSGHAHEGET